MGLTEKMQAEILDQYDQREQCGCGLEWYFRVLLHESVFNGSELNSLDEVESEMFFDWLGALVETGNWRGKWVWRGAMCLMPPDVLTSLGPST